MALIQLFGCWELVLWPKRIGQETDTVYVKSFPEQNTISLALVHQTNKQNFGKEWHENTLFVAGLCSEGEPSEPGGNRDCQLRTSELEQDLSSKSQRWNSKIDENYFPGCDLYPWGAFDNNHDLKLQYLSRCFLNIVPLSHVS